MEQERRHEAGAVLAAGAVNQKWNTTGHEQMIHQPAERDFDDPAHGPIVVPHRGSGARRGRIMPQQLPRLVAAHPNVDIDTDLEQPPLVAPIVRVSPPLAVAAQIADRANIERTERSGVVRIEMRRTLGAKQEARPDLASIGARQTGQITEIRRALEAQLWTRHRDDQ
jgi:hypothetical protein